MPGMSRVVVFSLEGFDFKHRFDNTWTKYIKVWMKYIHILDMSIFLGYVP